MSYEIINEKEGRGVVVQWTGVVTPADIHAVNGEIYAGSRGAILCYQIWDFTGAVRAERPQVSTQDARTFAMRDGDAAEQNPHMIIALVGSRAYFGGMADLYKVYADVWAKQVKCEIFETLDQARAWAAREFPELSESQDG
jgi:hypothetical protein